LRERASGRSLCGVVRWLPTLVPPPVPISTIAVDLACEPEDVLPVLERAAEGECSITRVAQIPATTAPRPTVTVAGSLPSTLRGFGMGFDFDGELRGHATGTAVRLSLHPRLLPQLVLWGAIPFGVAMWFQSHSVGQLLGLCALPIAVLLDWRLSRRRVERALLQQEQALGSQHK
jgi:hypothetical protein